MEAEHNIDDLLVKYLFNESEAAERLFVLNWINSNEGNRQHFERLKKTLELLAIKEGIDKLDLDKEWKHLQRSISANALKVVHINNEELPAEKFAESPGEPVVWKEGSSRRRRIQRFFIAASVAAAVIIVLVTKPGILFNRSGDNLHAGTDSVFVAAANTAKTITQHAVNTSGKIKTIALPDGSEVRLSNNSEITYTEPAGIRQRNVQLKGEADFAVAKDKTKPFTVFTGDISTMAVGTRFTVTDFEDDKYIHVRLDEGKVLVKSERTTDNKLTDKFYLLPGQKLIYDKNRQTANIRRVGVDNKAIAGNINSNDKTAADNPLLPLYNKKSWFMFNNQSLPEIFHALELMYDVKIVYAKKDVEHRYFIGTFSKSDSVENILHQIAVLNKLIVTKKENSFLINKSN